MFKAKVHILSCTMHSNGFNKSFDEVMGLKPYLRMAEFCEIIQFE